MPNPKIALSVPKAALRANIRSHSGLDKLLRETFGRGVQGFLETAVEEALFARRLRKQRSRLTTHTTSS